MKNWILAVGVLTLAPATTIGAAGPVTTFRATLHARAAERYAGMSGEAIFWADDAAVRYNVQIAGVKQITNVVLLDRRVSVQLYFGPVTRHGVFEVGGTLTRSDLNGLSTEELLGDMQAGRVEVVVFTVNLADGSIRGRVTPGGALAEDRKQVAVLKK